MSCRKRRSNDSHLDALQPADPNRVHKPSPTALTRRHAEALASHRPGTRLSRTEHAAVVNVLLWPFIGDRRNPLAGPRTSLSQLQAAQKLTRKLTQKVAA